MKENTWESTLDTNKPNPYKLLEEEVLEDVDEEKSVASDETPRISNMSKLTNEGKNDSQEYHIDYVTIEKLNDMIKAVFTDDKAELKHINRLSTDITTKLVLSSNDNLENLNLMLGKRVLSLEWINDECIRYIAVLNDQIDELTGLDQPVTEKTNNDYSTDRMKNI